MAKTINKITNPFLFCLIPTNASLKAEDGEEVAITVTSDVIKEYIESKSTSIQ